MPLWRCILCSIVTIELFRTPKGLLKIELLGTIPFGIVTRDVSQTTAGRLNIDISNSTLLALVVLDVSDLLIGCPSATPRNGVSAIHWRIMFPPEYHDPE